MLSIIKVFLMVVVTSSLISFAQTARFMQENSNQIQHRVQTLNNKHFVLSSNSDDTILQGMKELYTKKYIPSDRYTIF